MFARTIAREVAQVEPRGGYLRHIVEAGGVNSLNRRGGRVGRVGAKQACMMEKKINTEESIRSKGIRLKWGSTGFFLYSWW